MKAMSILCWLTFLLIQCGDATTTSKVSEKICESGSCITLPDPPTDPIYDPGNVTFDDGEEPVPESIPDDHSESEPGASRGGTIEGEPFGEGPYEGNGPPPQQGGAGQGGGFIVKIIVEGLKWCIGAIDRSFESAAEKKDRKKRDKEEEVRALERSIDALDQEISRISKRYNEKFADNQVFINDAATIAGSQKKIEDEKKAQKEFEKKQEPALQPPESSPPDDDYFKTPKETPEGKTLRLVKNYVKQSRKRIEDGNYSQKEQRLEIIDAGEDATDLADESFADGDMTAGEDYLQLATNLVDVGLGLTPGVGWAKDTYEAITGTNLITGEELTSAERSFAILGAATGGLGSKLGGLFKGVSKIVNVIRRGGKGKKTQKAADTALVTQKHRKVYDSATKYDIPANRIGPLINDMKTWGKTKGNFDIPSGTTKEANFLGENWVGPDAIKKDYGGKPGKYIYVSRDGTKQFREPVVKDGSGVTQANFQWKDAEGVWRGNGHMNITD